MKIKKLDRRCQVSVAKTAELYAQVFAEKPWLETWNVEAALQVVRDPLLRWWIAVDEAGQVVGFVAGCVASPEKIATRFGISEDIIFGARIGYKAELGVNPELRRAGLARRLSFELIDFLRGQRVDQFLVRTRPGTGNHPWYESRLARLFVYDDGRVLYGHPGVPTL